MIEAAHANDDPAITVDHLTFGYRGCPVLKDASLSVARGDFASIVGPNGGGKTTLLKLILGLLQPDRGRVRVFGHDPAAVRRRVGYLPQHSQHDPRFPVTVMDVVLMGRLGPRAAGPYTRTDRAAAQHTLEEVGLAALVNRTLAELSGGERQRALIARALVGDPELLLLDEPTAGVDVEAGERFLDLLRELNQRMTILLVSHDLGFVSRAVRTVICVNRRIAVHPTSEMTGKHIQEIYGQEMRMVRHDEDEGCRE